MQYDYFVASRYRNKLETLHLVKLLQKKGKTVYSFVESEASLKHVGATEDDAEEQMKKLEAIENWRQDSRIKEIFDSDMTALKNSEALILLLPAGKSAHLEAGVAYGLGKKCILVGQQKETETNYLIFRKVYPTIDNFILTL